MREVGGKKNALQIKMSRRTYKVLYDFQATDEGEMSVSRGELVLAVDHPDDGSGWTMVETTGAVRRRGFVPTGYVAEQPLSPRKSASAPPPTEVMYPTEVAPSHHLSSTQQQAQPILTVALEDSFLMNDVYYKQLVKQRQEAFARLETCVNTVSHEIRVCKERNGQLTRKVRELDSIIDQERRKWRERVEEEKSMLAKRTGM